MMNAKDAAAMQAALKTVFKLCTKENSKKGCYSKRCIGCPAGWPGMLCKYKDASAEAPWRWAEEYFKEGGE